MKEFLIQQLVIMIELGILEEVVMTHIHPSMIEERMPVVLEEIENILEKENE